VGCAILALSNNRANTGDPHLCPYPVFSTGIRIAQQVIPTISCGSYLADPTSRAPYLDRQKGFAMLAPMSFALICGGFFVLILLALGGGLIFYGLRSRQKAESSQSWPGTAGQITRSEVKQSANTDDDGNTSYAYFPSVEYTYQVAGQTYTSKRLVFGALKGSGSSATVAKELEQYPIGGQVTVYYNPEKPGEAVLERKAGALSGMMIIGIICLVLSLCIACPLLIGVINTVRGSM
jgi:hypothetical protein